MTGAGRLGLEKIALFERLGAAALAEIASQCTPRKVPAGQPVFVQGDPADEFFVLTTGRLKVTQLSVDGRQVVIRFIVPGDLFGIARALRRADYPGTATAVVDSALLAWPMSFWDAFIEKNPPVAVNAVQTVGDRLQEFHTRFREMATEQVESRVAHAILRLAEQSGVREADGIRIDFPLSKQDIAEMTGTTLHTVSRIMSAWQDKGLVRTGRRKLLIRSPQELADLARNGGG